MFPLQNHPIQSILKTGVGLLIALTFWVQVDGQPSPAKECGFGGGVPNNSFVTRTLNQDFVLGVGEHEVIIYIRENGAGLDTLELVKQ